MTRKLIDGNVIDDTDPLDVIDPQMRTTLAAILAALGGAGAVTANQGAAGVAAWPVEQQRDTAVQTAVIALGASLSGEIDLGGAALVGIILPDVWTAANLTFQVSSATGGMFKNLRDSNNVEVQAIVGTVDASNGAIAFDVIAGALAPWRFVKIRSGTAAAAIAQAAERTITIVTKV